MRSGTTTRAAAATVATTLVVLVAVASVVVTVVVRAGDGPPSSPAAASGGPPGRPMPDVKVTEAVASLAVLRDWDAARAAAWRSGDVGALRALYLPGSPAGERDAAMLRRWAARGLSVRRMEMQVLAVELLARSDRRIVLLVTDRLSGAVAVRRNGPTGEGWELPRDSETTRRLAFVRTAGEWRLESAVTGSIR